MGRKKGKNHKKKTPFKLTNLTNKIADHTETNTSKAASGTSNNAVIKNPLETISDKIKLHHETIGTEKNTSRLQTLYPEKISKAVQPFVYQPSDKQVVKNKDHLNKLFTKDNSGFKTKSCNKIDLIHTHKKLHLYKCNYCKCNLASKTILIKHIKMHLVNEKTPYWCDKCNEKFSSFCLLYKHRSLFHGSTFMCHLCGKIFFSIKAKKDHLINHKNPIFGSKTQYCKSNVRIVSIKTTEIVRKFQNVNKEEISRNDFTLLRIRIPETKFGKHEKNQKNWQTFNCMICSKQYVKSELLVEHLKNVHKEVKLFKCQLCQKIFLFQSNLTNHMVTHRNTNIKSCEKTGRDDKKNYKKNVIDSMQGCKNLVKSLQVSKTTICHRYRHVLRKQNNSKTFRCKECSKVFVKNALLIEHLETDHKKIELFNCQQCQRNFLYKRNLVKHALSHKNKKNVISNLKTDRDGKKNDITNISDSVVSQNIVKKKVEVSTNNKINVSQSPDNEIDADTATTNGVIDTIYTHGDGNDILIIEKNENYLAVCTGDDVKIIVPLCDNDKNVSERLITHDLERTVPIDDMQIDMLASLREVKNTANASDKLSTIVTTDDEKLEDTVEVDSNDTSSTTVFTKEPSTTSLKPVDTIELYSDEEPSTTTLTKRPSITSLKLMDTIEIYSDDEPSATVFTKTNIIDHGDEETPSTKTLSKVDVISKNNDNKWSDNQILSDPHNFTWDEYMKKLSQNPVAKKWLSDPVVSTSPLNGHELKEEHPESHACSKCGTIIKCRCTIKENTPDKFYHCYSCLDLESMRNGMEYFSVYNF